jgi:hypothetical protein
MLPIVSPSLIFEDHSTERRSSHQTPSYFPGQKAGFRTFAFARVRDEVRERLRLGGIEAAVGSPNFHERVTDGVRAWQQQESLDAVAAVPRR